MEQFTFEDFKKILINFKFLVLIAPVCFVVVYTICSFFLPKVLALLIALLVLNAISIFLLKCTLDDATICKPTSTKPESQNLITAIFASIQIIGLSIALLVFNLIRILLPIQMKFLAILVFDIPLVSGVIMGLGFSLASFLSFTATQLLCKV